MPTVAPLRFRPAQVRLYLMESSRTSNGLSQKHVRHPRGTLINYIFTGSDTGKPYVDGRNHTVNHRTFLAEAKYYKFSVHNRVHKRSGKINRVFKGSSTQWI